MLLVEPTLSLGQLSALKIIYKNGLHEQDLATIENEANILKKLIGQPNIVQLKNYFESDCHICIEMEYI